MANFNNDSQKKSQQDGLERVIGMRQSVADSKAHKGDGFMLLLIAASCVVSFQFRSQATELAQHLHSIYSGQQVVASHDAKSVKTAQAKHAHKARSHR